MDTACGKGLIGGEFIGVEVEVEVESTSVDGKFVTDIALPSLSFPMVGGGISVAEIFRFLPFGAGSNGGDRLYVTVLVTTERTLTGLIQALLGASKYRRVALSTFQSADEKGE